MTILFNIFFKSCSNYKDTAEDYSPDLCKAGELGKEKTRSFAMT